MANARRGFKVQLSSLTAAKCSLFRIFVAYVSLNSRFAFSYAYFSIYCNLSLIQANICPQNFLILLHFFLFFAVCFYFRIFGCCGLFALLLFIYLFLSVFEVIAVANLISGFLVTHFQQSFSYLFFCE